MAKIGNFMTGANIDNQDTVNTWIGSGASFKSKLGHGINTAVRLAKKSRTKNNAVEHGRERNDSLSRKID